MSEGNPALFFDPLTIEHNPGMGHPERPERLQSVVARLNDEFEAPPWHSAPPAGRDDLLATHGEKYVDRILALRGESRSLDPDTILSPRSVEAALQAAGLARAAVLHTVENGEPALALIRPPGHHAERQRAMGFCIFNNVAVAADFALSELDIHSVLIVDWDVHHGNGTQQIFYDRRDVLFFSTHQAPFYPGTGALDERGHGHGAGYTINLPFPAGTGDATLLKAFRTVLVPVAHEYQPDLILLSAGYDAHRRDPIGGMQITTEGFAELTGLIDRLARALTGRRLAVVLEGGYHLEALAESVLATVNTLSGAPRHLTESERQCPQLSEPSAEALHRARLAHADYWSSLA